MAAQGSLAGRLVVVTGGSGDLGGAVVDALRAHGADVHAPTRAQLDTQSEDAVRAYYASLPRAPWASVHLVGGFSMAPLTDTTLADARTQWDLNFATAFLCTREAARRMKGAGGRIVNVVARAALTAPAQMSAYASSKAAVVALTQVAAAELKDEGVLVNAVAPSIIDTARNRADMPRADHASWPKPAEIAQAIVWLASPDNALTSGAVVPVYGRA